MDKKDIEKFEQLVLFLASKTERGDLKLDEEITNFEDAIESSKLGSAYFGIAKDDYDRIEIARPEYIPYTYKKEGVKLYAQYYDGNQAPFIVCKWCDSFNKLEELLKNTSSYLYELYLNEINKK